jgi:N-methylhydantoinase A
VRALGIDVGGTFTDAVLVADGVLRTAKVPTRARQEESVLAAAAAVGADDVERFTHGTTIATNALLERRGARTAFVATDGFEHLLHLRRQTRAHLYRPCAEHPSPLVPLERCVGVAGRMGPVGELRPLDLATLPEVDAEAIAVCLLFSFRHPEHEQALVSELRRRHPEAHIVASFEVAPEFREYERASTTVVDAYLGPLLARYLRALGAASTVRGLPEPLVMRSSGGLATLDEAASHAAYALLSGPAAGVVGAAHVAGLAGFANVLAFDMGGTSTDVCAVVRGRAQREQERTVGGLPVRLPTLAVHTVGAGGGSIVSVDVGGALRVGPESAGADPGPACYGRGGTRPTVTDANLLLGRLPRELPGGIELDAAAARRALRGLDPHDVLEVVNAEMVRALRVVSVEQGLDPRDFALVAFGGAGPLHACALADELGMETVLVPAAAGVLSALGLVAAEERIDAVRSYVEPLEDVAGLPSEGEADLRYRGQSFELTVPLGPDLAARFHEAHAERYGYADPSRPLELVAVRTAERRPAPKVEVRGRLIAATGPETVLLEGATVWVEEGWTGETDEHGTLVLRRRG